jgi:hypothetical protein
MALWVSGVVLFTLTVNAPALGPLMNWLELNKHTPLRRQMNRCVCVPRARDSCVCVCVCVWCMCVCMCGVHVCVCARLASSTASSLCDTTLPWT